MNVLKEPLFYVLMVVLLSLIGVLVYQRVFNKKRIVRILWFDKIGKNLIFKGEFKAFEHNSNKLGLHLRNTKLGFHISYPDESELFPSYKGERVLPVTRFSPDDWRILRILKDQVYFREVEKPILVEVDVPDASGGVVSVLVPKKDKNGKILTHWVREEYSDPLGITQKDREVMRFNRDFHQEMDELKKKDGGWWSKYGAIVINAIVIVAFMIFCIFLWKQNAKMQETYMVLFDEKADAAINAMNEPSWVEKLVEKIQQKEIEANVPLS